MISQRKLLQIRKDTSIPLFLFFITIVSRIPFRSRVLYHMDSVQYALATEHYDISVHQPHPPGYFLYVMLGKLLNTITHDSNTSFVIISILASGALVVAVYALAKRMFNERTALAASLLAMTSPIIWFHGEVALNYILEGFLSTLIAYYCWRTISGEEKAVLAASLALAFAAGIRQTMLMFLLPLWLLALVKVPARYKLYAFALLILGIISWFLPMVSLTGGYMKYREAAQEYMTYVAAPLFQSAKSASFFSLRRIIEVTLHGLGLSTAFFLFYLLAQRLELLKKDLLSFKGLFIVLWVSPPLFLYVLVFISSHINAGYSLIYLPVFIILASGALTKSVAVSKSLPRWFSFVSIVFALIINSYMFILSGSDSSSGFLKTQEERLNTFVKEVRSRYSSEDTIILSRQYILFGPRHFMYYLPEYRVYLMNDSLPMQEKARQVFWGQYHSTHLSDGVHIPEGIKYFISPAVRSAEGPGSSIPSEQVVFNLTDQFRFNLYDIKYARLLYPSAKFVEKGIK